ncbi:unnamed protein product [Phytophthora lilii]|uniref:Unnamed protein product n=1 Tax=Phytophthora lilii TaxID=2077276 RepID=A0A9W6U7P7_9STRA|nr:unnamed protein product [Phytophthora lilii]
MRFCSSESSEAVGTAARDMAARGGEDLTASGAKSELKARGECTMRDVQATFKLAGTATSLGRMQGHAGAFLLGRVGGLWFDGSYFLASCEASRRASRCVVSSATHDCTSGVRNLPLVLWKKSSSGMFWAARQQASATVTTSLSGGEETWMQGARYKPHLDDLGLFGGPSLVLAPERTDLGGGRRVAQCVANLIQRLLRVFNTPRPSIDQFPRSSIIACTPCHKPSPCGACPPQRHLSSASTRAVHCQKTKSSIDHPNNAKATVVRGDVAHQRLCQIVYNGHFDAPDTHTTSS